MNDPETEKGWSITFARSARKELEALQRNLVNRILPRIENLAKDPRPHGCRKLTGAKNRWRIRVGDYRVIYSVSDKDRLIDVIAVRHRSEAYD